MNRKLNTNSDETGKTIILNDDVAGIGGSECTG